MLTCSLVILALFASSQGRAVNISNTWVLPEEGFPVFYRYFRDRISWYEADAVCQFHHANLVTVDTTAQYDAVRAYLKELDISSAVWVGLIRSNPDGDFTWTDYRGLSGDGYWSAAPDARAAPLCAAADPSADYRWEARSCGGPSIASFICELPVPQWALGNEGCMVRALPALTVLYLPESAAVQLTADCGLAGVKRVQCTGNVKRETLLKGLSCNDESESSTTLSPAAIGSSWSTSDSTVNVTDWDISETTPEEETTTEYLMNTQPKSTQLPAITQDEISTKKNTNKLTKVNVQKVINLVLLHNNNLQSNDIPKLAYSENFLTVEQSEKLEDEKHMHHKMLHDELAKHANYETIFTQPTDHFVPPLVMAKAKISDDMTVLSLAEKHAQQLAEQRLSKHNILKEPKAHIILSNDEIVSKPTIETLNKSDIADKPLVLTLQTSNAKESSKKIKSGLPKKYIEKYEDPKVKNFKIDGKLLRFDKSTEKYFTVTDVATKLTDPIPSVTTETGQVNSQEESIELTVRLKEPNTLNVSTISELKPDLKNLNDSDSNTELDKTSKAVTESVNKIFSSRYDNVTSNVLTKLQSNGEESNFASISTATTNPELIKTTQSPAKIGTEASHEVSMRHEVIKITIINNDDKVNPTHNTFEVTTIVPKFTYKENVGSEISELKTIQHTDNFMASTTVTIPSTVETIHDSTATTIKIDTITTPISLYTINNTFDSNKNNADNSEAPVTTKSISDTKIISILHANESKEIEEQQPTTEVLEITKEKADTFNISDIFEETDRNVTDQDVIDDFNSPLLSAASEPLHRPNRSRRPQQPTRLNKFNPFRILG